MELVIRHTSPRCLLTYWLACLLAYRLVSCHGRVTRRVSVLGRVISLSLFSLSVCVTLPPPPWPWPAGKC
ncbi:unnamed protein product [Periconia digitata]|uniref:Uncharacterized protein n=1 Tax=Periconia digitata TaxID=1303443 RepID=A0A9W4UMP6_9PLEO|nr:unnamed protein product [Periconia digitata]